MDLSVKYLSYVNTFESAWFMPFICLILIYKNDENWNKMQTLLEKARIKKHAGLNVLKLVVQDESFFDRLWDCTYKVEHNT